MRRITSTPDGAPPPPPPITTGNASYQPSLRIRIANWWENRFGKLGLPLAAAAGGVAGGTLGALTLGPLGGIAGAAGGALLASVLLYGG